MSSAPRVPLRRALLRTASPPQLPSPRCLSWRPSVRGPRTGIRQQHARPVGAAAVTVKEGEQEAGIAEPVAQVAPLKKGVPIEETILLQAFGWDSCDKGQWYNKVKGEAQAIADAAFTHVWLPPASQSVAPQGYLPGQLYNLNSKFGHKDDLIALNKELKAKGLVPVADIVINHRCADEQDEHGVWNNFRDDTSHKGEKIDWGVWAITGDDPQFRGTGAPDTGEDYGPAPDLDHLNEGLRSHIKEWMSWLATDIGFGGWRFDFVKGYGPQFVAEYIRETLGPDLFHVGEYWVDCRWNGSDLDYNQNEARQILCNWIDGAQRTSCAFDFVTKGILQEAVKHCQYDRLRDSEGKPPGLLGWWQSRAVLFVDNHDTGSTQQHWPFPASHTDLGYAYILTHPGIPCILREHFFECGEELRRKIAGLIALRKRAGINARSRLEILAAEHDMYVARIDDKVTVKLGPRYHMGDLEPKEGWKFHSYGNDYAVWERT